MSIFLELVIMVWIFISFILEGCNYESCGIWIVWWKIKYLGCKEVYVKILWGSDMGKSYRCVL